MKADVSAAAAIAHAGLPKHIATRRDVHHGLENRHFLEQLVDGAERSVLGAPHKAVAGRKVSASPCLSART